MYLIKLGAVRANAFHLNSHSGFVRLVHFGNRAISLENFGSLSSLVYRAYGSEEPKTTEALCYLRDPDTGSQDGFIFPWHLVLDVTCW